MSSLQQVVSKFLDQREEYVRVLRQCVDADADYHRWQGNAEARRTLSQDLERDGIDLSDTSAPVHLVRVEFDGYRDSVDVLFICQAASDAPCHMVCAQECEQCDHERTRQVDYCNEGEFINSGGEGAISQADKQGYLTLPVDTSWNGDTYVWKVRPPRDEATVKAEALRDVAQTQRQLAADSRTGNGQAEHEDRADWLDEQADAIDPARLEGAHP